MGVGKFCHASNRDMPDLGSISDYAKEFCPLQKTGTCARDRCALQQLALNVHIKHSDLT